MTAIALVVDDEADLCRLMQMTLTKMGIKSHVAYDLAMAYDCLASTDYDFCLTDLRLPDGSGLDLVKHISQSSAMPIAVITAHGSMDLAIEALKLGAFDFVNKPLELPKLRQLVKNALKVVEQTHSAPNADQTSPSQQLLDQRLIGNSAAMTQLKATIIKLARSQAPVFLWGESGTGKEVVARLIHDLSPRKEGSFVAVNCGAIPTELMESEFFGHKKGSFTGATADKVGLFQQAHGGTLFLDELADLPLTMQVKLLRAIQEKSVRAIGDTAEVPVDVRILSATHKDLSQLVQDGSFRQDLFYRINVIELKLPTLNERESDIPALAQHFLQLIADDWQLEHPPTLTPGACERLKSHDFEGNVRELRNLLERAVTLTDSSVLDENHLGIAPMAPNPSSTAPQLHQSSRQVSQQIDNPTNQQVSACAASTLPSCNPKLATTTKNHSESRSDGLNNNIGASQESSNQTAGQPHSPLTQKNPPQQNPPIEPISNQTKLPEQGLEAYLQSQEKALIITALNQANWNKTQAAKLLGTSFRSLRYRMKKLQIQESSLQNQDHAHENLL